MALGAKQVHHRVTVIETIPLIAPNVTPSSHSETSTLGADAATGGHDERLAARERRRKRALPIALGAIVELVEPPRAACAARKVIAPGQTGRLCL